MFPHEWAAASRQSVNFSLKEKYNIFYQHSANKNI